MLLLVLATVLLLSIVGLAVLSFTATTARVSATLSTNSSALRQIDGAFETAINDMRLNAALTGTAGLSCSTVTTYFPSALQPDVTVTCVNGGPVGQNDDYRILDLTATRGTSPIVSGRARVRINDTDTVSSAKITGYSVEVCDWQLGGAVSPDLHGCST